MGADTSAAARHELARLGVVSLVGLALSRFLLPLSARHAPVALQNAVSFASFRALSEIAITVAVLALAAALLPLPRVALGLRAPSVREALAALLAAPIVSVLATYAALGIALPFLLEELAHRGAGASRANAGGFGQELTASPVFSAILGGSILAALAEETVFRGALYAFLERALGPLAPPPPAREVPPELVRRAPVRAFAAAWGPTILAGALFGVMHWDLPGAVGIVRVASTTFLGLAAGAARKLSGALALPWILHAAYNALALGTSRGWFARGGLGSFWGVPVLLSGVAAACLLGALVCRRARRSDPAPTV